MVNAYIDLNSERYPEENLNIDFGVNNHVKPYKMAVNYYKNIYGSKPFPFTIDDFKEIYPLLVFDVSKQRERLKIRLLILGYEHLLEKPFQTNVNAMYMH